MLRLGPVELHTPKARILPLTFGRLPLNILSALEPIRNQFPTSRDGDEGRYQKKPDNHLNNAEVYGIAGNKPPGDYRGNDHDWAKDQIQHVGDSAGTNAIFEKSTWAAPSAI
jgi:hypothetical protein